MMHRAWLRAALLSLIAIPASASAHSMNAALLRLDAHSDGTMEVLLKVPRTESGPRRLRVRLPSACRDLGDRVRRETREAFIESWQAACTGDVFSGQKLAVDGLDPAVGEVFVHLQRPGRDPWVFVLSRETPETVLWREGGSRSEAPPVAERGFFILGIEHILSGPDHLLFVLALLLLVIRTNRDRPRPRVVSTMTWTVTAFTVAHSLTLAGSVLGLVRLPAAPVEIVIALSVLLVAVELTRTEPDRTLTARHPWAVAFAFGLLHGFGFAGALRQVGLPEQAIGRTLFLFNLGVEAGQLIFLAAVGAVLWFCQRWKRPALGLPHGSSKGFEWAAAYVIGVAAVFWCLQRAWLS